MERLRMNRTGKAAYIAFGDFRLNLLDGTLVRGGSAVPLSPKEFDTLRLLMERSPHLVTKEEFVSQIWPDTFVGDSSLARNISVLRKLLGDGMIETVAKRGYRFTEIVSDATGQFEQKGEPLTKDQAAVRQIESANPTRSWGPANWKLFLAASLTLASTLSVAILLRHYAKQPIAAPELEQRQLTSNFIDNPVISSAISPDGKYLAYTDLSGMHVQLIEGGQTTHVTPPDNVEADAIWSIGAWFQNSTKFLANLTTPTGETSAWAIPVFGGEATKLRDHASATSISPDGSQIAFTTARLQNDIAVQDRSFAFLGDREVWAMSVTGTAAHRLFYVGGRNAVARARWSPDGKRLAYLHMTRSADGPVVSLEIREANADHPTTLVSDTGLRDFYWLADGKILYALCSGGGLVPSANCNLFELNVNSRTGKQEGVPRRLTNWAGSNVDSLSVPASSRRIALQKDFGRASVQIGELTPGLKLTQLRNLTDRYGSDTPSSWTVDSKEVIFRSDRSGQLGIYKQRLDSRTATKVADGGIVIARAVPDGQWIIYLASVVDQSQQMVPLMRVPTSGGPPEQILLARSYAVPSCAMEKGTVCGFGELTQDGNTVVIYKLDPLSGRGPELARFGIDPRFEYGWSLSPDGRHIAVIKGGSNELRFISLATGSTRQLNVTGHTGFNALDWRADNSGVFVSSPDALGVNLLFVDLNGSSRIVFHEAGASLIWAIPAPDGRHIAIPRSEWNSNVWLVDSAHAAN